MQVFLLLATLGFYFSVCFGVEGKKKRFPETKEGNCARIGLDPVRIVSHSPF